MLEVLIPATNKQLTTLSAVKAVLDIPEEDTSRDVFLNALIDQAVPRDSARLRWHPPDVEPYANHRG